MEAQFTRLAVTGAWGSLETPCGPGSTLEACSGILERLPKWIKGHGIRTIVDLGCGDFHWMGHLDLSGLEYDGYDVVRFLVERNVEKHQRGNIRFHHADLTTLVVPKVDLLVLKDVLIHLPTPQALEVLGRARASGSRFLASTTSPGYLASYRARMTVGDFAPVDLEAGPFSLGAPLDSVEVPNRPGNPKKFFALWKL